MPFVTAGDPDLEFTAAVLAELVAAGRQPVRARHSLQRSDRRRAGDSGLVHAGAGDTRSSWPQILEMLGGVTPEARRAGGDDGQLRDRAIGTAWRSTSTTPSAAGAAGAIVPDLPVEEAGELAKICREADFSLIQLVTPTTPRERAAADRRELDRLSLLRLGDRHHRRADRSCRRAWSTTSAGSASRRRCRSASASASAARARASSWPRWPTA